MRLAAILLLLTSPAWASDIELSRQRQIDVADLIRAHGYQCDLAKSMHTLGPTSRGPQLKIACGPAERDGLRWAYRVTTHPNQTISIEPCHVLWCWPSD